MIDLSRYQALLIDRDGVLNRGKGGPFYPEVRRWLERLRASGRPFLIATNHSTSSPERVVGRLQQEGIPIERHHLHTPLDLLTDLFERTPPGRTFARGAPGFLDYLRTCGVELVENADAHTVVLGFDRSLDYAALSTAIAAVIDHGAQLIAMHENRLFRTAEGDVEPGLGAWVRAIEYATGVEALIVGKPSAAYYHAALEKLGAQAAETVMISDDPYGDLAGAKALGMTTVFVLSGKYANPDILTSTPPPYPPDVVLPSLADLEL